VTKTKSTQKGYERPQIGDVVAVVFWDHANGGKDALRFEVFGRITDITKNAYRIDHWRYVDDIDRASDDNTKNNEDWHWIVKKAIESIKRLK
jgi:hypothetical protein